jgi:predicted XRE-type DNA-binding protein
MSFDFQIPDRSTDAGGGDPERDKAEVMRRRLAIMVRLSGWIKGQRMTQVEAARHLGVPQSRICRLLMGKAEDFTLDTLLVMAARAGMSMEVRFLI